MNKELDKTFNRKTGFRYRTIDAKTHVRLLQISHADELQPGGLASYHLVPVALEDLSRMSYKALSYTWGSAHLECDIYEIQVDAQPFFIRRNLYDFLTVSVAKDEYGFFFIDAICINQLDLSERRFQVPEMTCIYRNASEVVAWLGHPEPSQLDNVRALSLTKTGYRATCSTANLAEGFRYLSHHGYWDRIWIVQEVLLAKTLTIWCGFFVFSPELFKRTSCNIPNSKTIFNDDGRPIVVDSYASRLPSPAEITVSHRMRQVLRPATDTMAQGTHVGTWEEMRTQLREFSTLVENFQSTNPDLVHKIVRKFSRLQCSDPRDKFYGLLGLLNEKSRAKVKPDYSKDVSYAHYQALKIGLEELYFEHGSIASGFENPHREGSSAYMGYYCDVRDAFNMDETRSVVALRRVLDELGFHMRFQEAILEVQWQQQFVWRDTTISVLPDFKRLLKYCEEAKPEGGVLFRFRKNQRRKAERL
jgi:hypothetical protein